MKRFLTGFITTITLAFVGCLADAPISTVDGGKSRVLTATLSSPSTKTSLGNKDGDTYPVLWSEEDQLVVNGVVSEEMEIASEDKSKATFHFGEDLTYPYHITYPYTSSTTADAPKVEFLAEQNYEEGSFAKGSVPMCGYAESKSGTITLKHLAGILRFPVKARTEGVKLQKVVITSLSGAKLSGVFSVDCKSGAITPSETTGTTITYNLPANFTLSTSSETPLYISIPSGSTGNYTIEFIESNGEKMVKNWKPTSVKAGFVTEFKTITYNRGVQGALEPLEVETDHLEIRYPTIYGYVKDTTGKPIKGVAVSDGFSVVATDANGYYKMNVSTDTWYIYISVPAEYEIPVNEYGQPCFYKKYPADSPQFDFTLTPLAGGKEKKFALFTFGDPQVSKSSSYNRFMNEAIPEIKKHSDEVKARGIPCYGITLGDIISNGATSNSGKFREPMRDGFAVSKSGLPVFQVMGNHDNTFFNSSQPLFADEYNSLFEYKAQREHEDVFGPANYSFNRGDVHIVGMRDIIYRTNLSPSNYQAGFLPSQYEWLKQDLALVPKDKMVVLCVHIQLFNRSGNYVQEVLSLLDQYKEAHIMSGHSHVQRLYEHSVEGTGHKVFEHNACAVCGAWWSANVAGDGTPNGYNVWIGEGNTFTDWYYMGYNKGMNTRATSQIRLYRGNAKTGAEKSGTDTYGVKGYYQFNFADDVLLANVFNADSQWVIKVYENGVHTGNMTKVSGTPKFATLIGDGSFENPHRVTSGTSACYDFYAVGMHLGVLGRCTADGPSNGAYTVTYHMYQYKLKNKNAKIKVEAIDRFGNKYSCETFYDYTNQSLIQKP